LIFIVAKKTIIDETESRGFKKLNSWVLNSG